LNDVLQFLGTQDTVVDKTGKLFDARSGTGGRNDLDEMK